MHDAAWVQDEKQVKSMLTNFVTWASLTRDVEMIKGQELCEASNENIVMPWDVQMCTDDLKLVHRTQPMLGHGGYKFDQTQIPAMSGKDPIAAGGTDTKSRFGLPREKVRKFTSLLHPQHIHSWRNVPPESYVWVREKIVQCTIRETYPNTHTHILSWCFVWMCTIISEPKYSKLCRGGAKHS